MVNVGIAGIGFMGVTHYKAWADVSAATVSAICTRSDKKLQGDWSSVQGNFGGGGGVHDLRGIGRFGKFDELLHDDSLDLIDVCLPTPMHVGATVAALEAGKHTIVEKPIALNVADARRMIEAANANGRLLFVAQVLRFMPQWVFLKKVVQRGDLGRLLTLNLRRIISLPQWSADIADLASHGGPLIDLHIHDADFILYVLGRPASVSASGIERDGVVTYVATTYDYREGPRVTCQCGAVAMAGRPFKHEFEACFEKATICHAEATEPADPDVAAGQSAAQVLTVYHEDGSASYPSLAPVDGFCAQLTHVAQCVASGQASTVIAAASARDALALVIQEGESVRCGRSVTL